MELRAVHCLLDGRPAMIPAYHLIPSNLTENREANGRLGGRVPQDFGGGDHVHVHTITNRRPQGGVQGAQG